METPEIEREFFALGPYLADLSGEFLKARFPRSSPQDLLCAAQDWGKKPAAARSVAEYCGRIVAGGLRGKRVLELGTGTGVIGMAFRLFLGAQVSGLDVDHEFSQLSVRLARRVGLPGSSVTYDGTRFPFREGAFEFCISTVVFEHCDDTVALMQEVGRVLRKGGRAFLSFPNKWLPYDTHTRLPLVPWFPARWGEALARALRRATPGDYNLHFYSYLDFKRILVRAGGSLRVVSPSAYADGRRGWRERLKHLLWLLGLHHTALLRTLCLVVEKR